MGPQAIGGSHRFHDPHRGPGAQAGSALDDEQITAMFRSGDLDLIQTHLLSMQQIESVVAKSAPATAPAAEATEEGEPAVEDMGLH